MVLVPQTANAFPPCATKAAECREPLKGPKNPAKEASIKEPGRRGELGEVWVVMSKDRQGCDARIHKRAKPGPHNHNFEDWIRY